MHRVAARAEPLAGGKPGARRWAAGAPAPAAPPHLAARPAALTPLPLPRPPSLFSPAVILGGGAGTRLYPLTKQVRGHREKKGPSHAPALVPPFSSPPPAPLSPLPLLPPQRTQRAKPAVPIGGAYRLIDVPMSNCINSGINKVYVLTQFNSTSLNRHLARTYNVGSGVRFGGDGFVEVLAATQTPTDKEWFQGTADAVRQYAWLFADVKNRAVEDVVILSGDHLCVFLGRGHNGERTRREMGERSRPPARPSAHASTGPARPSPCPARLCAPSHALPPSQKTLIFFN